MAAELRVHEQRDCGDEVAWKEKYVIVARTEKGGQTTEKFIYVFI